MKKILICFAIAFVIVSNIFVCAAVESSDLSVANNQSLSWDIMNKCSELDSQNKGYLLVYSKTTHGLTGSDLFYSNLYNTPANTYWLLVNDKPFVLFDTNNVGVAKFTDIDCAYLYDSKGNFIKSRNSSTNLLYFNPVQFDILATNIGLYNEVDDCVFYSTCVPVAQGFYISFMKIVYTIKSAILLILPVLIIFFAIRKGWNFAKSQIKGA